ncbi:ORC1-type DNA replication protein [archaeon]|jgi:archaeal cell division control protein 6|nr:ORC1-type DNA replication protein [archaeon]
MGGSITDFFKGYLEKERLFTNKKVLQMNYTPETIPHREEQIEEISKILAPSLKLERPSNMFIYGKTGTGKTLSVIKVLNSLKEVAKIKNIPLDILYVNCKLKNVADTEYRLIAHIAREFGEDIPITGLPRNAIYSKLFKKLETKKRLVILALDEIDQIVKKQGDEILYTLTRINTELENAQVCFIGISNDLRFASELDPRIKSSLTEEEMNFPPYNAIQLRDILSNRANLAFKENSVKEGVIEKCAALAAREHGDARRALDLLRIAGELAEREDNIEINISHIDTAEEKMDKEIVIDAIKTLPKQSQLALLSTFLLNSRKKKYYTGDVSEEYKKLCFTVGLKPLSHRRLSDLVEELVMLGIIRSKIVSKGRYGRKKEISVNLPPSNIPNLTDQLKTWLNL